MKTKSTGEKADVLRSGYDLDALLKKDARGKYANRFVRLRQVEKNRHPCLGGETRTKV
jgi:hypothetical protein